MVYFLTFRSYGTWLHGDERGSVDRLHNQRGEALLGHDKPLKSYRRRLMKSEALLFDEACCACIETTMHEVATHRQWEILALNVLSNHVHVVVGTAEGAKPEKVMSDLKAYTTRRLRERQLLPAQVPVWSHHGSTRYLSDDRAISAACHYVMECQEEVHDTDDDAHEPGA